MSLNEHLLSIGVSAVMAPEIVASVPAIPDNTVAGLASAILVQTLILGLTELRKWLVKRRNKKEPAI